MKKLIWVILCFGIVNGLYSQYYLRGEIKNERGKMLAGVRIQLASEGKGYIIYTSNNSVQLNLTTYNTRFNIYWIDPQSGKSLGKRQTIKGGKIIMLQNPAKTAILWADALK